MIENATRVCICLSILGGSLFGYSLIGISSAALTVWRCYYGLAARTEENQWWTGALFAIVNVGGLPYGLFAGTVLNTLGRKKTVTLAGQIIFAGTVLSMCASLYAMQAAARVLTGLGIGMIMSSIPVYIAEVAPESKRGTLQALFQVSVTLNIMIGSIVGYYLLGKNRDLLPRDYCPLHTKLDIMVKNVVLLGPGAILAGLIVAVGTFFMPESPAWQGYRSIDAEESSDPEKQSLVSNSKTQRESELTRMISNVDNIQEGEEASSVNIPSNFFGMCYAPRSLICAFMLAIAQQATGINAVMFYAPKFLALGGVQSKMLGSVAIMVFNFITATIAMFLVDRMGRRTLLLPSIFAMAVSLMLMPAVYDAIHDGKLPSWWCFILLFGFIAGFEFGPGTLFGVLLNEIFPEEVLPYGAPLVGTSSGVFALITTTTFPPLELMMGTSIFYVFGGLSIIVFLFTYAMLHETAGLSRKEITESYVLGDWFNFGKPYKAC